MKIPKAIRILPRVLVLLWCAATVLLVLAFFFHLYFLGGVDFTGERSEVELAQEVLRPEVLELVESERPGDSERPHNLILLIGDGMGSAHVTAARAHLAGIDGRLAIDRMPVVGLSTTHSFGGGVTDSSAAITAIAAGIKTTNNALGVDPDGERAPTFFDLARSRGVATGVITTSEVTDATPAVFFASSRNRHQATAIAAQLAASGIDLAFGGGARFFRSEERLEELRRSGYTLVRTNAELEGVARDTPKILGLFAEKDLTGGSEEPTLEEMAMEGIEHLEQSENGFALMVESAQVDDAAHDNDTAHLMHEMKDFDAALSAVLDFARRDGETLVVVTSDHETGGLLIVSPRPRYSGPARLHLSWNTGYGTGSHTGTPVPVYAYGPGAVGFTGSYDNTELYGKILQATGWDRPQAESSPETEARTEAPGSG